MRVGLTAPGAMGAGLGGVLAQHGVEVRVRLDGRSDASRDRSLRAGLTPVEDDAALADTDVLLSVCPPADALPIAERLAPWLGGSDRRPLYVDANAVSPGTARRIGDVVTGAGGRFCDGGIIGLPPGTAAKAPVLFVSGPDTTAVEQLGRHGLEVRRVDGRIGSASALKMSYAGITKGLIALGSMAILNAEHEHVGPALAAELGASQAGLLAGFRRGIPDMAGKAGRWVAEMEEIAATCPEGSPAAALYRSLATFYAGLAGPEGGADLATLAGFFEANPG